MIKLSLILGLLLCSPSMINAQDDPVAAEVALRQKLVMEYFDNVMDMEELARRSVSNMVDIYLQGTIRIGNQLVGRPDVLQSVYIDLSKNHLKLLGDYMTDAELADYIAAVIKDADQTDKAARCNICDHPKKTNYDYCVFCGKAFE